jgi:hypothetical protein
MRIALLTIHHGNSYGGMLQALASKLILSRYGEVTFLNYASDYLSKTMRPVAFDASIGGVLRAAKNIARLGPRRRLLHRFREFQDEWLRDSEALARQEELFEIFVAGSDQIWNPATVRSFDLAYFLDFVKTKPKIAFASSAGSYRYSAHQAKQVRRCLSSFSALGVREQDLNRYLTELLQRKDIRTVLDPTLMLTADEWRDALSLRPDSSTERYLLVYALKLDRDGRKLVEKVSGQLGLPVVAIDQEPILRYQADRHVNDAGPKECLDLLSNAAFVVTDSFHATAFSVNFQIPFLCITPRTGANRLITLLSAVGLENLMGSDEIDRSLGADFNRARLLLSSLRHQSLDFLSQSINNAQQL